MVTNKENLYKLGQKMTDRIPYKLGLKKLDESCPEYWGLAKVLDDDMVSIALSMKQRTPMTLEDVSKSSGWTDLDALEKKLHEMGVVGLIEWNWENDAHIKQYILPLFVPGAAEFLNMRKEVVDEHPEVCDFFNAMTTLPLEKVTPMVPLGGAGRHGGQRDFGRRGVTQYSFEIADELPRKDGLSAHVQMEICVIEPPGVHHAGMRITCQRCSQL